MVELVVHVVNLLLPLLIRLAHQVVEARLLIKLLLWQVLCLLHAAARAGVYHLNLADLSKQLGGGLDLRILRPPVIVLLLLCHLKILLEALLALCRFFVKLLRQRTDDTL